MRVSDGSEPGELPQPRGRAEVRADPRFANVLLVAVSGYGRDEDRRRAREAGFDHHLTKPLPVAEINALIRSRDQTGPGRPPGR